MNLIKNEIGRLIQNELVKLGYNELYLKVPMEEPELVQFHLIIIVHTSGDMHSPRITRDIHRDSQLLHDLANTVIYYHKITELSRFYEIPNAALLENNVYCRVSLEFDILPERERERERFKIRAVFSTRAFETYPETSWEIERLHSYAYLILFKQP